MPMLCTKIKCTKLKCMHILNVNVQGCLYESYSTRKFIVRNIFNTKIWRFMVLCVLLYGLHLVIDDGKVPGDHLVRLDHIKVPHYCKDRPVV